MKTMFIMFAIALVMVLATVLACAWLENRKHAYRVRGFKSAMLFLMLGIEAALGLPAAFVRWQRYRKHQTCLMANGFTPSTHEKETTKFSAVAIATRYLLGKQSGATGVVVCGAGDRALFVIKDTVSAAELVLSANLSPVGCIMLGVTNDTIPMVAAGALNVGDIVYPVAAGQVNTYVGLGSSGTNYPCGIVVGSPATQAGDIVEVMGMLEPQSSTN